MLNSRPSVEVLEQEFLPVRAKILEIAAGLDRMDRGVGSLASEARRAQIQAAIQILLRPEDDRAEQVQLIFSRDYNDDWREEFGIEG
ncbi:MAG TPA: hypothetical protein VH107_11075 [Lacipirellulaceae bacterium]|jgi:hypothetical protein|nr:hypothetical protein [Lacipirellulaceae bacterium]